MPRDLKFSLSRDSTVASVTRVGDFRLMVDIMARKPAAKRVVNGMLVFLTFVARIVEVELEHHAGIYGSESLTLFIST